jgi:putative effector of murein hydrolase LrgA (UPF0299 family)
MKLLILKLLECVKCEELCDKYLECDGTLILLDLALQNTAAYRHVLLNQAHFSTILRLALVTIIVDGYSRWAGSHTGGEFFEQEFEFYSSVGEAVMSLLVYMAVTTLIVASNSTTKITGLLEGLLLAYNTRFLKLCALLWVTPDTTFLWTFVDFFFLLTSVKILQVQTTLSNSSSMMVTLVAHAAMHLNDRLGWMLDTRESRLSMCNSL